MIETKRDINKLSAVGMVIATGIVFGDLGTSPLYVFSAIVNDRLIEKELIYGAISLVFMTLTIITSIKYIYLFLKADNQGEGGILSLFALIRRYYKYLYIPAIIGACCILADGMITPAISITSAIEGLNLVPFFKDTVVPGNNITVAIIIIILVVLFLFQSFGTIIIGKFFGPVMVVWFSMLFLFGAYYIVKSPEILKALNPYYGIHFLWHYPKGFWVLGSVFLAASGAEALYHDLGHCGRKNIQMSWIFIKISLIANYLGQGVWLMTKAGTKIEAYQKPIFLMMPEWFLLIGIFIATMATIIASQSLITGSFTLISEAINLKFWPRVKIKFPSFDKKINFIPSFNFILFVGSTIVILFFRTSDSMGAAYGLSISATMLMTSLIYGFYLRAIKKSSLLKIFLLVGFFLSIEFCFFIANLQKFFEAGIIMFFAFVLITTMLIWYKSNLLLNRNIQFIPFANNLTLLNELSKYKELPYFATHTVYLTQTSSTDFIEKNIIDSILKYKPKRADMYWFVLINRTDISNEKSYKVQRLNYDNIHLIELNIAYNLQLKLEPLFTEVLLTMFKEGSIKTQNPFENLTKDDFHTDFTFVFLEKYLSINNEVPLFKKILLSSYFFINNTTHHYKAMYGLDKSHIVVEKIPIVLK